MFLRESTFTLDRKVGASPELEKKQIKRWIGMGWSIFGRQHNAMKFHFPLSLKRKCILPALTYGDLERKFQNGQRGIEIIMFGITWEILREHQLIEA